MAHSTTVESSLVQLAGRVQSVRRTNSQAPDKITETVLILPAPNAYSSPGTVAVLSSAPIGSTGDDVQIICRVSGFARRWESRTPEGYVQTVHSANNILTFVDFVK